MEIEYPLVETDDDETFIECLMILVIVQVQHERRPFAYATDDYLCRLAARRHPGTRWTPYHVERLKARYVTRSTTKGTTRAARYELLEQWAPDRPARGGKPPRPAAYLPTGVLQMMDAEPDPDTLAECLDATAARDEPLRVVAGADSANLSGTPRC